MHEKCWPLLQNLPEPLLIADADGRVLDSNHAFRALAARCSVEPNLSALFGVEAVAALERARRAPGAEEILPLAIGPEPRQAFRLSVATMRDEARVAVLLVEATWQSAWRALLDERDRTLDVLRDVGATLSGVIELDDLTERTYQQTHRILPTRNFYIALADDERTTVSFPRFIEDGEWREMVSRPWGTGLTEYVIRTGEPLLLNRDVRDHARRFGIEPQGRPSMAWMGVPLIADGRGIGMIGVQDYDRADCYGMHDLEALMVVAGQAAAAIKVSQLFAAERRALAELAESHQRLLETERVRGINEAVGALNHEINNPLTTISGCAQLLLRPEATLPDRVRAKIESIFEAARRIERVTAKMGTLIQASSAPYPGQDRIIDVRRSVARGEAAGPPNRLDKAA